MKTTKKVIVSGGKLLLLTSFLLLALDAKAQTYVAHPMTGTPSAGQYYSNSKIVLNPHFSFIASRGNHLQLNILPIIPDCAPLSNNFSNRQNYVLAITPRIAGYTPGDTSYTSCDVMQTIQYFDGLGRPLQTVQVKGSPLNNDIVIPFAYDQFGREAVKYLPYTFVGTSDGSYKANALSAGAGQAQFYISPPTGVSMVSTPQAVTVFESSPLNRMVEQGAPGDAWQVTGTAVSSGTSGHTMKTIYASNDGTSYWANQYGVNIDVNGNRTLVFQGTYGIDQLNVIVNEDENWNPSQSNKHLNTTEEYKDKDGHVVLKRTYNFNTTTNLPEMLSTYYVYDDIGNLAYVLPPASGADANGGISSTSNQSTLNNLCYQYGYDARNRLITKQLPGKGLEEIVYNQLDQVIFNRDANQKGRGEWNFTKYDGVGRVIITGITKDTISRAPLQSYVINMITQVDTVKQWEAPAPGSGIQGYTDTAFPWGNNQVPLIVNYYDDYAFQGQPSTATLPTGASSMTVGLPTATKTAILDTLYNTTPKMLWTVHYYDDLGRVTQTYAQHYLGGTVSPYNYDVLSNSYDFTNELTATTRQHYAGNTGATPNLTIANIYTYDHTGRKKQTFEQINSGTNVLLSQTGYNEIGQLLTKHLHSTNYGSFLQNTNYAYNERGWLLKINDPALAPTTTQLFTEQLTYNQPQYGGTPQFNGNIAEEAYTVYNSQTAGIQTTTYSYDNLNRLVAGNNSTGFSETGISYDLNGNLLTLTRNNYGTLNYTNYSGNQLMTISGFKAGSFVYDNNGNVISDGPRGATITYNMLNLPQSVTASTPQSINYTYYYDANGTKLRKLSNGQPTDYVNGIQYKADAVTIDFIMTEEGRAINSGGSYNYEYTLTDHLGNNRVTFDMVSGKVGEDDYYPFGLNAHRLQNAGNKYLYNKKELQEELGQYDYGARFYDPVIARWNVVDPKAETSRRFSSYVYGDDNPIRMIDPDGMESTDWYTDKLGHMKFDVSVKKQADVDKVSPGGKYQGPEVKTKGATYFKDGSAFFKNETKAYQFMWNNSNVGQGMSKETENFAWITNKGVAVLPTNGVKADGTSFKFGQDSGPTDVYKITGAGSSLTVDFHGELLHPIADIHTHPDNGFGSISYHSGSDVDMIKGTQVPGFVISTQKTYGMSVSGAFIDRGRPVTIANTSSLINGTTVIISNINLINNYMNSHE
jgi:RHS repeat-associated protein